MRLILFTAFLFLTIGCATLPKGPFTKDQVKPMMASAIDRLGQDLMKAQHPLDAKEWCPKFQYLSESQRKDVFLELGYRMIERESNFDPANQYVENFTDNTGKKVISRGLAQISLESSKSYGCGFEKAEEIHDPQRNIDCFVRILNRWIPKDNRIGGTVGKSHLGCARYHSVCRNASGSRPKIVAKVKGLAICN